MGFINTQCTLKLQTETVNFVIFNFGHIYFILSTS